MRKIVSFLLLAAFFAGMAGCNKNFAEVNANPNNPEVVNPELLMVTIIRGLVNEMNNDAFSPGNIVAQYSAEIRDPSTDRYQWTGDFGVWDNGYQTLQNVQDMYDLATAQKLDNYRGVALVMRALIFARLTDCYGDLPYSQALMAKADPPVYSPKYDRQADIYVGITNELRRADSLLGPNGGYLRNDILYNNDYTKWKKLANTLRMRLLMRESNKVNPSADMQEMLNDTAMYPLFASNDDNAALTYSSAPNISPITNQRSAFFLDRRLSRTLADEMNSTNDPRLPVYAQPTVVSVNNGTSNYVGVRNGETDANLSSNIDDSVSALGIIYYNGLNVAVPSQGLVMTYSELQFILAEAAQRGWITGNPQTYYEAGIKASVDYYSKISGIALTVTPAFLSQPGIAYDPADGLRLIGTQKWVALYFNDLQGWMEWKRTGYPALTPSITNYNNNKIPVRFLYPTNQQVTNETNYKAAVATQGADDINTKIWWMN
jgi:hypothetical protein